MEKKPFSDIYVRVDHLFFFEHLTFFQFARMYAPPKALHTLRYGLFEFVKIFQTLDR